VYAYSYLKRLLEERQLSVPELHRRMSARGMTVNRKSLYRLTDNRHPVDRLDMRVAGAICSVCSVGLSDWIRFEGKHQTLQKLTPMKQSRLDLLMGMNNQGTLTEAEREELRSLVKEAEEITLANARLLSQQQQRLASPPENGNAS
jgi:hypothetical protein